ncbi:TIGR02594 family protein [Bradyrhizobium mercantei]|uniref:TIGR02594 family protein n=1 Tax=Bradyrhizobium mercantei TaxID=1904807 RepID=UPI000976CE99|nr:TIGR02594 family protein [Bradyrhizobium mercantei]
MLDIGKPSRRTVLATIAGAMLMIKSRPGWTQSELYFEIIENILHRVDGSSSRGTGEPTPEEDSQADAFLATAPAGRLHPFVVAQWFLNQPSHWTTQTPPGRRSRANPVIIKFFTQATRLQQTNGDETWWCAAFANWCLLRAQQARTDDARSSSFRNWMTTTAAPQVGDIAVFQNNSTPTLGHVGFYAGPASGGRIRILGGNQHDGGLPTVCERDFVTAGKSLTLHSFHRDPGWPSLA